MKNYFILICLLALNSSFAQKKAVILDTNDTIIVNDNGTWTKSYNDVTTELLNYNVKAVVKVDEMDGSKSVRTDDWIKFGKSKLNGILSASLILADDVYLFSVSWSTDLGCFSSRDTKMAVKLTNGEIIEFGFIGDTDCGEPLTGRFVPASNEELKGTLDEAKAYMKENVEKLKKYDWELIRLHGTEYYTDITPFKSNRVPNPEQFFRQHIIVAESKF